MKWTDTLDIALELIEAHPDVDPQYIRFTDLHKWVCALPGFNDDPEKSNEKFWKSPTAHREAETAKAHRG